MKKILAVLILLLPTSLLADHLDVIPVTLQEDCSLGTYLAIAKDFNEQWGKENGYIAEVAVPIQSDTLDRMFWLGRSANAAAFGAAYDKWIAESADPNTTAGKLWRRLQDCQEPLTARRGYLLH